MIAEAETLPHTALPAHNTLHLTWLGQSGFLLQIGPARLLLDPYLSDSLTTKYAQTNKPHERMHLRVMAPGDIRDLDVITSSHNHTDHLDAETLIPLMAANPQARLVIPEANRAFVAQRLGIPPEAAAGLDDGTTATICGWEIHGIAAAHNALDRNSAGQHLCLGYIIRRGGFTLYHSGDTLLYPGLAERLSTFGPIDVALLPINGNRPERGVAGNLDGAEAATLAHDIGARLVIPCHYDMFRFNTADPGDLFIPTCEKLGQHYRILQAAESLEIDYSASA